MAAIPEHFERIADRVNLDLIGEKRVVIIGLGTVGSPIALELAGSGVRRFLLIDGDALEAANITKHVLKQEHIWQNKAEGMAEELRSIYPPPSAEVEYLPQHINGSVSDDHLDQLLADADLVIAATDNRTAQHRIAARALANDIPAIFPALYGDGGGEVFVSLCPSAPCLLCWEVSGTRTPTCARSRLSTRRSCPLSPWRSNSPSAFSTPARSLLATTPGDQVRARRRSSDSRSLSPRCNTRPYPAGPTAQCAPWGQPRAFIRSLPNRVR